MQSEALAQEFARLVAEYRADTNGPTGAEAWNLIADFAVENAATLYAALEAEQPVAVEVEKLKWREFCSRSGNSEAKTSFGEYVIQSERDGWMLYLLNEQDARTAYSTIDFAKAAAQQDYETRILSTLVNAQADADVVEIPAEPTDEMIEAGEEEIASRRSHGCRVYAADIWGAMVASRRPAEVGSATVTSGAGGGE